MLQAAERRCFRLGVNASGYTSPINRLQPLPSSRSCFKKIKHGSKAIRKGEVIIPLLSVSMASFQDRIRFKNIASDCFALANQPKRNFELHLNFLIRTRENLGAKQEKRDVVCALHELAPAIYPSN
jgi:hypothetical protein